MPTPSIKASSKDNQLNNKNLSKIATLYFFCKICLSCLKTTEIITNCIGNLQKTIPYLHTKQSFF